MVNVAKTASANQTVIMAIAPGSSKPELGTGGHAHLATRGPPSPHPHVRNVYNNEQDISCMGSREQPPLSSSDGSKFVHAPPFSTRVAVFVRPIPRINMQYSSICTHDPTDDLDDRIEGRGRGLCATGKCLQSPADQVLQPCREL